MQTKLINKLVENDQEDDDCEVIPKSKRLKMMTNTLALNEQENRRCSLRKLEIKSNSLQINKLIMPTATILKKQKSTSHLSSTTTTTTTTTNSFACLRNLGSTCYVNCIIQVMRYTPGFVISLHRLNKKINQLESFNNMESEINFNNNVKFVKNLHQVCYLNILQYVSELT